VPFLVRAGSLITLPVFVAIFVLEPRRRLVYLATVLYFLSTAFTLLLGLRGGLFALVLALWYVAGIKSRKKTSIAVLALVATGLILVGDVVQTLREDSNAWNEYMFAPIAFVMLQGNSIEVTEAAVKYRPVFAPYSFSYLFNELENAFQSNDVTNYFRGKSLAFDVPVQLDRTSFNRGRGTGGSYIGEAYVLGGVVGVALVSLLIGAGLHYLYHLSRNVLSLVVVGLILPDILIMPRGNLLDWLSVLLKYAVLFIVLYLGWLLFGFLVWLRRIPSLDYAKVDRSA
jgi:oligosaccharide repeat unit polymerase